MTFGEHLEELRRRLIVSILYLIAAVIICLSLGDRLMMFTLRPHYRAIEAAMASRLVAKMDKTAAEFRQLMGEEAGLPGDLTPEDVRWSDLFRAESAAPVLENHLRAPFSEAASKIGDWTEFSAAERNRIRGLIGDIGESLTKRMLELYVPEGLLGPQERIIRELDATRALVASAERLHGPSKTQALLGLGRSFENLTETLDDFRAFLEKKREEVRGSVDSLAELTAMKEPRLAEYLVEAIEAIDSSARQIVDPPSASLMVIHYLENFMAYLKVSLIFGLALAFPFILLEMWKFVGAGLYDHEQKYVRLFVPFSLGLFVLGVLFGYFYMIPFGLQFLAGWGIDEVNINITLGNYLGLFITLTLLLGLVFQIPLAMVFLSLIDLVRVETMRRMRRPAIFILVCLSAIITPPDPITLLLMAGPLVLLYEVGIWVSWLITERKWRARRTSSGRSTSAPKSSPPRDPDSASASSSGVPSPAEASPPGDSGTGDEPDAAAAGDSDDVNVEPAPDASSSDREGDSNPSRPDGDAADDEKEKG